MNIIELEITTRSYKALKAAGITTVEQLVRLDWEQLNSIENIGQKSITEICWQCIQLLSGQMTEQRIEWEKRWPSIPANWEELIEKADKYDKIARIVGTER